MKKIILTLIVSVAAFSMRAQNINPEGDHAPLNNDQPSKCQSCSLSGWVMDLNFLGGLMNQNVTHNNLTNAYINPLNPSEGTMNFNDGMSYGFEAQAGYFFGKKKNWGIGMGLMYLYQTQNITDDKLHVEYATYDNNADIYRQEVTATHQIKETIHTSNLNIPIVAKYQTRISKKVGFTADAGILFNLLVQNNYKTNATFDYEAIYQYVGSQGSVKTVYDAGNPPATGDLLITKSQYLATTPDGDINAYFNSLKDKGYNVGLNQSPANNKGHVSYMSGSVGLLIRPAITIDLCNNLALNLGVYYYYQNFSNKASSNYRITDKLGEYSSMQNTVTSAGVNSYGINIGLRYKFCKKAEAPAPVEIAPIPEEPEPIAEVASPVEIPEEEPEHVDISTPLLFDLNKVIIKQSSIPILQEAVRELKANPSAKLTINGYTDNTGAADYNKKLSKRRAAVVKNYLKKHGVDPHILKTVGHGQSHPAATNRTRAGRARNRRVIMKVKN